MQCHLTCPLFNKKALWSNRLILLLSPAIGILNSSNKFEMIETAKEHFLKPSRVKFKSSNMKKVGKFSKKHWKLRFLNKSCVRRKSQGRLGNIFEWMKASVIEKMGKWHSLLAKPHKKPGNGDSAVCWEQEHIPMGKRETVQHRKPIWILTTYPP